MSLALICSDANAAIPSGFYVGAFGGGGNTTNNSATQTGTAFFPAASGGPLAVNAHGNTNSDSAGIGGLHAGYEWLGFFFGQENSRWNLVPAAELEGYYLGTTLRARQMDNPTTRVPEHTFDDDFPMHTGVILANTVWTIKIPCVDRINPYVGAGVGAATISISSANSSQENPLEVGINHFNSNPGASDWAFAAQAKLGLRYVFNPHWRVFAEYRFLYLASTNYTFGSTQYTTHVPTTNWNVHLGDTSYNMGAAGVEFSV